MQRGLGVRHQPFVFYKFSHLSLPVNHSSFLLSTIVSVLQFCISEIHILERVLFLMFSEFRSCGLLQGEAETINESMDKGILFLVLSTSCL